MIALFRQGALFVCLLLTLFGVSQPAAAEEKTVLTVSVAEAEKVVQYSLADLRALPAVSFETSTIWTSGTQQFTGVSLAELAALAGVDDGWIQAHAMNDYAVKIPFSDAVEGGAIVAYERNGQEMPLRGKGPLWIVYPFDSNPEYRTEKTFTRSIWQLDRIEFNK